MTVVRQVTRGELQAAVDEGIHCAMRGTLTVVEAEKLLRVAREADRVAVGSYSVPLDGAEVDCPVGQAFPCRWRLLTWDLAFAVEFDSAIRDAVRSRERAAGRVPGSGVFVAEVIPE